MANPGKPFRIAKQWSFLLLEEFMAQAHALGDREKELGIDIQPMNDRDKVQRHRVPIAVGVLPICLKVSRPLSQIGFIEFVMVHQHERPRFAQFMERELAGTIPLGAPTGIASLLEGHCVPSPGAQLETLSSQVYASEPGVG
eukprot:95582-Amphidinium_carterae.2